MDLEGSSSAVGSRSQRVALSDVSSHSAKQNVVTQTPKRRAFAPVKKSSSKSSVNCSIRTNISVATPSNAAQIDLMPGKYEDPSISEYQCSFHTDLLRAVESASNRTLSLWE